MKEFLRLLSQIDTWQCSPSRKMYPDLDPKIEEINKLFAQIDILQEKIIKIRSRDTLICESVVGILTPTPPGVEFWKTKIRFYCAGHRKNEKITTTTPDSGSSLCGVNVKIQKKIRILD